MAAQGLNTLEIAVSVRLKCCVLLDLERDGGRCWSGRAISQREQQLHDREQ